NGAYFVALLGADFTEVIENLALRDTRGNVELLEQECLEGLGRAIEIVRLEGEHAEIFQDLDRARIDLERHVELVERLIAFAERGERLGEAMVIEREILRAASAERGNDLLEHLGCVALASRRGIRVA